MILVVFLLTLFSALVTIAVFYWTRKAPETPTPNQAPAPVPTRVLKMPDQAEAERRLDTLIKRVELLIENMPDTPSVLRIRSRWKSANVREGPFREKGVTSYTVNKGEEVVMCLRDEQGSLHDENMLMYVLLHELAHIASESVSSEGHNEEFLNEFHFLLDQAIKWGVYLPQNKKNVTYCSTPIRHLP